MVKKAHPVTPGIRTLRRATIPFTVHQYKYADKGGARQAAEALGLDTHAVVKTLVFQDAHKNGLLVLMHGDAQVSAKQLARQLKSKQVAPCDTGLAMKLTGYKVGGISPFGTRNTLPVYVESSIFDLETIYINGGKRGLLVQVDPTCLKNVCNATPVAVALPL